METENSMGSEQLRIASFAVYLKPGDDSFVKKLMESEGVGTSSSKVVGKDGEIGVFGAERYFNMSLEPRQLQVGGVRINPNPNPLPYYSNSKVIRKTTPSIINSSSESSWTTQSSTNFLKANNLSTTHHHNNNKLLRSRRGFFAGGLSCYKSCNDTKSIYTVAPPRSEKSILSSSLQQDQPQFTFPVMIPPSPHRPSLEVFGSKPPCNNNVAMNLERKLSVLTWDAIPSTRTTAGLEKQQLEEEEEEDKTSEASSDLFEIQTMPPCMYAPSEASIEWSVVTASAPDFSDYKLDRIHPFNLIPSPPSKSNFRESPNVRGLLGCNNHKAVQVVQTNIPVSSPQLKPLVGLTNK